MKMDPPSDKDWKIASSIASSFVVGNKGGFPNAKFVFNTSPTDDNEGSSDTLPRRFADHTYRDFSTYINDGGKVQKHKKSESNFPARLYAMLAEEKYSHIISWMVSCALIMSDCWGGSSRHKSDSKSRIQCCILLSIFQLLTPPPISCII